MTASTKDPDSDQRYDIGNRGGVYDRDEDIAAREPGGSDPLEDAYNAPSATDRNAGANDPSERDNEVAALENAFAAPSATDRNAGANAATNDEKAGLLGKGYTGKGKPASLSATRRRVAAIGGTLAFVAGVFGISIPAVPSIATFKLMNFAEHAKLIQGPGNTQMNRVKSALYLHSRSESDAGHTRTKLGVLGRAMHPALVKRLQTGGFDITTDGRFTRMRTVTIDSSKVSWLQGKTEAEMRQALADRYKTTPDKIVGRANTSGTTSGGRFRFSVRDANTNTQGLILGDALRSTSLNKISVAMMNRYFRAFYGIPRWYNVFDRASARAEQKIGNWLDRHASKRVKRIKDRVDGFNEKIANFREAHMKGIRTLSVALVATSALCTAREVGNFAYQVTRDNFILPAMESGASMMAAAAQAQWPTDMDEMDLDAWIYNAYDKKTNYSVWDGNYMASLSGKGNLGNATPNTEQYQKDYARILDLMSLGLKTSETLAVLQNPGISLLCSPGGQATQAIAGIALMATGTGIGLRFATNLVIAGVQTVAIGYAMNAFADFANEEIKKMIPDFEINQGPLGGDFALLGTFLGSNAAMVGLGASKTTAARWKALGYEFNQQELRYAQEQPFYDRVLNPNNIRSPIAKLLINVDPRPAQNISNATESFANIASFVTSLPVRLLTSPAKAADIDLAPPAPELREAAKEEIVPDLGHYAIPEKVFTAYPDPLGEKLDNDFVNIVSNETKLNQYSSRILTCWGATVTKENNEKLNREIWGMTTTNPVDVGSPAYIAADCADEKDNNPEWTTLNAYNTFQGSTTIDACFIAYLKDACREMGYGKMKTVPSASALTAMNGDAGAGAGGGSVNTGNPSASGYTSPIANPATHCVSGPYSGSHAGIDFRAPTGVPILAVKSGTVVQVSSGGDSGNGVLVRWDDGRYSSYQHMSRRVAQQGASVTSGQILGYVGNTGYSFGPHLHFTLSNRETWGTRRNTSLTMDPMPYLSGSGVRRC